MTRPDPEDSGASTPTSKSVVLRKKRKKKTKKKEEKEWRGSVGTLLLRKSTREMGQRQAAATCSQDD